MLSIISSRIKTGPSLGYLFVLLQSQSAMWLEVEKVEELIKQTRSGVLRVSHGRINLHELVDQPLLFNDLQQFLVIVQALLVIRVVERL